MYIFTFHFSFNNTYLTLITYNGFLFHYVFFHFHKVNSFFYLLDKFRRTPRTPTFTSVWEYHSFCLFQFIIHKTLLVICYIIGLKLFINPFIHWPIGMKLKLEMIDHQLEWKVKIKFKITYTSKLKYYCKYCKLQLLLLYY